LIAKAISTYVKTFLLIREFVPKELTETLRCFESYPKEFEPFQTSAIEAQTIKMGQKGQHSVQYNATDVSAS